MATASVRLARSTSSRSLPPVTTMTSRLRPSEDRRISCRNELRRRGVAQSTTPMASQSDGEPMSVIEETPDLGRIGVWQPAYFATPEFGQALERLGYGTVWLGGSPPADLKTAEALLDATTGLTVATG